MAGVAGGADGGADSTGGDGAGTGVAGTPGVAQEVTVTVIGSARISNASNLGGRQIFTITSHELDVDSLDDISGDVASCAGC